MILKTSGLAKLLLSSSKLEVADLFSRHFHCEFSIPCHAVQCYIIENNWLRFIVVEETNLLVFPCSITCQVKYQLFLRGKAKCSDGLVCDGQWEQLVVHGCMAGTSAVCTSSSPPLVLGSRLLVSGAWSFRLSGFIIFVLHTSFCTSYTFLYFFLLMKWHAVLCCLRKKIKYQQIITAERCIPQPERLS